ncbi:MAG: hypothetical protein ABSB79_02060 [Syntrophales bacterium]|jgi:hypothetical protein
MKNKTREATKAEWDDLEEIISEDDQEKIQAWGWFILLDDQNGGPEELVQEVLKAVEIGANLKSKERLVIAYAADAVWGKIERVLED